MPTRRILRLTGRDIESFLQGLVTNDVSGTNDGLVYAALLTPQGKYIADFFLFRNNDSVLLDVAEFLADDLTNVGIDIDGDLVGRVKFINFASSFANDCSCSSTSSSKAICNLTRL